MQVTLKGIVIGVCLFASIAEKQVLIVVPNFARSSQEGSFYDTELM